MWFKILFLSLIFSTTTAVAKVNIQTDISAILNDVKTFNNSSSNITDITNYINNILGFLNLSDIEVNIILNRLEDSQTWHINEKYGNEFENSIKYLFQTTLHTNWFMKYILQEVALTTNNLTVHEILYEILWQELKSDRNKTNPFLYIELYRDVEYVLENFTSDKLLRLRNEIQNELIILSAQILQSYFIHNSTIKLLLEELKQLNNLYQKTIPKVFENINTIESQWHLSKDLLEFDAHTQEAVYNHISYIEYLQLRNEVIPQKIYDNLEILLARPDLENITITQRQKFSKLLPKSMGNLLAGQRLCLRNTTTNVYIFECPQTYLMCTNLIANNVNPINRKKAAYVFERIGNNQYQLRSPYWGRHFHLQNTTSKNTPPPSPSPPPTSINVTSSTISPITKNLYSHSEASSWLIHFHGDYVTIQDSTKNLYVCGGDPSYWANTERYTYTRPSKDFYKKQNECLWLLEDCSDVI